MDNLTEKIDGLFAEQKGAEAEKLLEQALQEAYEKQDFAGAVPILNELIGYCRETSQVERSYAYAEEVKEILQKLGLERTLPHATTLLNIANAYRAGGRLEDSLTTYEEAAEIYGYFLEPEDMLWASLFNNISLLYQEMGRYDVAKECLLKALEIVMQKPDTIFEQAVTYTNLAASCLQLGQGEEAEKYFTGAILLFERHGILDTHYCAALSSLATYLYQKQEYKKAEEYFAKAMQGIEAHLGRNEYYYRMEENARICGQLAAAQEKAEEEARAVLTGEGRSQKKVQVKAAEGEQQIEEPADVAQRTEVKKQPMEQVQDAGKSVPGLALCREYYEAYGKPMLESQFPEYVERITVGLVGEGSDCFGYDDALSQDHDWGPSFCMWVSEAVYEEIGEALEEAYEKLPKQYKGYVYQASAQGRGRRGVHKVEEFYRSLLGAENCPKDGQEWSAEAIRWEALEDDRLAVAVNGELFAEGDGSFGKIREILTEGYPLRIRYLKIAEAMARFSQAGQYNYSRMLERGDKVAAQLQLGESLKEAMKLLYYMKGDYPPHDKWLFHGLLGKTEYAEMLALIERALTDSAADKSLLIERMGAALAYLLYQADIISDVDSFLQEHIGEVLFKASVAELSVEELAEQIAGLEFEAFDKVKNQGGRADCQDDWFTFSIMRKSQYLTWNQGMLVQYYYDFQREYAKGHNLIEEKYGRMMESTAPTEYEKIKTHFPAIGQEKKQIIEGIVAMQVKWMEEFAAVYPKLAGNARSIHTQEDHLFNTSYETYLRGEISTYSDKMLELYGRYIVAYAKEERNPARDIMEHSVWMYGYEGLDEAEAVL